MSSLRPVRIHDPKAVIDGGALRAALIARTQEPGRDAMTVMPEIVALVKETLGKGRAEAERRLLAGGRGIACARELSHLQDEIIGALYQVVTSYVLRADNPTEAEKLCVAAVGGYGRGTLAPGSDIDLLFLLPYKQTPWGESVVEFILYVLWDLGFKVGHATRSVAECVRLSQQDMTIRTSILEARFLGGDNSLFQELEHAFAQDVVAGTGREFVEAKLAERRARHNRTGASRYLVEPNIKDGKGGLRDLNTLFWIARYTYGIGDGGELVELGVLTRDEYRSFRKAEDFLWAVRCHLHFLTGRAEDRLTFDLQPEMARRLGYTEHPGQRDVERFMKHYFLIAKTVGDLTRIFCAALEEQQKKTRPSIGRFLPLIGRNPFGRRRGNTQPHPGFTLENNRLSISSPDIFADDPVNLLRLFHLAEELETDIHPDALKAVRRALALVTRTLRQNADANRLFLETISSAKTPDRALRLMNEAGLLGRFVPDFGRIVALMQFNMYHHYTADEHLIRAIGILSEIERGSFHEEHPLATQIFHKIQSRVVLYVALFLHDIAKGRPEDHSMAGARIARKLCPRFDLTRADTDTVAWLVEHHLLMSDVAQRRDLSDPKTVRDFAKIVQSPERLRLLLILTVADIRAVGPGVWNGWKGQLLRQLYYETESILLGGHSGVSRAERVASAKTQLDSRLKDWPSAERDIYLSRHYDAYWLSFETDIHEWHARFVHDARKAGDSIAVATRAESFQAITEVLVYTADHPGLFSQLAGACALSGANIVDAKIFTTTDGMALDSFSVQNDENEAFDEERRLQRLKETITQVVQGRLRPPDAIRAKAKQPKRKQAFTIEPEVVVNNSASDQATVIEVAGLDRLGLLHDLTRALFRLNLTISSAHVTTYGERAVDVFYVSDLFGMKIVNAEKITQIRSELENALRAGPSFNQVAAQ
jgi:[protein-PII] uridylyltransferase